MGTVDFNRIAKLSICSFVVVSQVASVAVAAPSNGSALPPNLQRLVDNPPQGSLGLQRTILREVKNQVGANAFYSDPSVRMSTASVEQVPATLQSITAQYESMKTSVGFVQNTMVKPAAFLLKMGLTYMGGVAAPTGLGPLAAAAGIEGVDKVEEMFADHGQKLVSRVIGDRLAEYREKTNSDFSEFAGLTPEEAYRKLMGVDSPAYDPGITSMIEAGEGGALVFALKSLQDSVVRGDLRNIEIRKQDRAAIEATMAEVGRLEDALAQFAVDTTKALKDLKTTQDSIQQDLAVLTDRVDTNTRDIAQNTKDIAFLQEFIYAKMDVEEKIAAIENGVIHLPPEQKQAELERLDVWKKRRDLEKTAVSILNGAAGLIEIGKKFNLDPKFLRDASTVVNTGQALYSATQAFMTGNYISCVMNIAGLFGGGQRDIAGERHAEIMNALGDILRGQREIMQALNEGFNQVYQNQQKILDAIVELSITIEDKHRDVMAKLNEIQSDVLVNRQLILAILEAKSNKCPAVIDGRQEFGFMNGAFASYGQLVAHHKNYDGEFGQCLSGMQDLFTKPSVSGFHPTLYMVSYEKGSSATDPVRNYRERVYEPAVDVLRAMLASGKVSGESVVSSLYFPVGTTQELNQKLSKLDGLSVANPLPTRTLFSSMENLISVDALERNVRYLLSLHGYFEILDRVPDGRPYAFVDLVSQRDRRVRGRQLLEGALRLVDVAIAQQTLISGDVLLPLLAKYVDAERPSQSRPKDPNDFLSNVESQWTSWNYVVNDLLAYNPMMAHNAAMYTLRVGMGYGPVSNENYEKALALTKQDQNPGEPYSWRNLMGSGGLFTEFNPGESRVDLYTENGWLLQTPEDIKKAEESKMKIHEVPVKKGWSVRLSWVHVPFPTSEEFAKDELRHTAELEALYRLKGQIIDEILTYDFATKANLTEEQKTEMKRYLLNGI